MKSNFLTILISAAAMTGFAAPALALADKGKNDDKSFQQLSQHNSDDVHKVKDKVKDNIKSWDLEVIQTKDQPAEHQAISAVPEPETYALMLAGLGAMAFVARRRKA